MIPVAAAAEPPVIDLVAVARRLLLPTVLRLAAIGVEPLLVADAADTVTVVLGCG